jgi:RNA polymerase sigma factor (sigma-70 family)
MSASFDHNILPSAQKMYRFAWSILRDEDSAHDVVQECLTKIWHKRDTLQSIQNHEAWIMRIVRKTVIDESHDEEEQKGADHDLIYKDQEKWLNQTLSLLSEVQREIFHLREIESFSYQEIADAMSLSINEVKVYLHRARQKVRAEMLTIESYGIAN